MFPVYILDGKTKLPEDGTYYIVARDGLYLSKDTGIVRATVRVNGIAVLKELKTKAALMIPSIPVEIMAQTIAFFRAVYEEFKSESIVVLYYSKTRNEFVAVAPEQKVSGASVDYAEPEARYEKEGLSLIGTIHSHCDFGAFHSGTDIHDERNFDGIHITIGRVDQPYFTVSSMIAVNNNRFPVDIESVVSGIVKVEYEPPPIDVFPETFGNDVMEFAGLVQDGIDAIADSVTGLPATPNFPRKRFVPKTQFYDIILLDGDRAEFPREWMKMVSRRFFGWKKPVHDHVFDQVTDTEKDDLKSEPRKGGES